MEPLRDYWIPRVFPHRPEWHYRADFFAGSVALDDIPRTHMEPEHKPDRLDDNGLDAAVALLKESLPQRYEQFQQAVAVVHPVVHELVPSGSLCSNSGNTTVDPPGIFLTVTHPTATAEAFVHEMAHHKLIALGVTTEDGGSVLDVSARKKIYSAAVDRDRPVPAVLHAAYSFLHMVELDLALLENGCYTREARLLLEGNRRVAESTTDQLKQHATPGPRGEVVLALLYDWAEQLLHKAKSV